MKQFCLALLILVCSQITTAQQDVSVDKSLYGIQTGFWGIWVYNESRLSPKWALRSEVGLFDYLGLAEGLHLEPIITLEPRWYFNQARRLEKGKRIDANSGSFLAIKTSLRPSVFTIPVEPYRDVNNLSISLVPMIGSRKNIGEKWNYELGFGLGVEYYSKGVDGFSFTVDDDPVTSFDDGPIGEFTLAFTIHLRIGYKL